MKNGEFFLMEKWKLRFHQQKLIMMAQSENTAVV